MPSPFPGMDPWLEHPDGWQGVHTRLIAYSSEFMQPQLRDLGYFVEIEERIYIQDSLRHVVPDLAIVHPTKRPVSESAKHVAVLEADEPLFVQSSIEPEVRERYLRVYTTSGRELVTQIEVISRTNKKFKRGRKLYTRKRTELRAAGINIVEIDLLRAGQPIIDLDAIAQSSVKPWDYLVNVVRDRQVEHEVYPIPLRDRLPRIRIPLRDVSPDVVLDLQAVFQRVYDAGPYPMRVDYNEPPTPPLAADDDLWADQLLRGIGLRSAVQ